MWLDEILIMYVIHHNSHWREIWICITNGGAWATRLSPAQNRALNPTKALNRWRKEPWVSAATSIGQISSRGSMAVTKRFINASYLGKACKSKGREAIQLVYRASLFLQINTPSTQKYYCISCIMWLWYVLCSFPLCLQDQSSPNTWASFRENWAICFCVSAMLFPSNSERGTCPSWLSSRIGVKEYGSRRSTFKPCFCKTELSHTCSREICVQSSDIQVTMPKRMLYNSPRITLSWHTIEEQSLYTTNNCTNGHQLI